MTFIRASKMKSQTGQAQVLNLLAGIDDPSNPFTMELIVTGGSQRCRLATPAVNGDGAAPDTAACKRVWIIALNQAYEAGTDLAVELTCWNSRSIATHSKVDLVVKKLGADGAETGADLCTTAEQTLSSVTVPTVYSFTVNGAGLAVGDRIIITVERNLNDTGAAGASPDAYGYLSKCALVGSFRGELPIAD